MRAFSSDEKINIENYKRCPNCNTENYWDNAEVWTIHRGSSFINYSKCSACGSTYRHLHSYFSNLHGIDVIHYHITESTFLKNCEISIKPLSDNWCGEMGINEFRMN
jgi:hypothetical protein